MVYIFLAEGFEIVEAMAPVDMCRRAGIDIKMISISDELCVKSSHGIPVIADILLSEADLANAEMLILPGGMPGTVNLENCKELLDAVISHNADGKKLAAICAAPRILGNLHLLEGKRACVYPGMEDNLLGATVEYNEVSVDGNIITARGMGCAAAFGGKIVAALSGDETANKILNAIVYHC